MKKIHIEELALYVDKKLSSQKMEQISNDLKDDSDQLDIVLQIVKSNVYTELENNYLELFRDKISGVVEFVTTGCINFCRQDVLAVRSGSLKTYSFSYYELQLVLLQRDTKKWDLILLADELTQEEIELVTEEQIMFYPLSDGECTIPLQFDNEYLLFCSRIAEPLNISLKERSEL